MSEIERVNRVEELQDTLLGFDEEDILEALVLNSIIDRQTGMLTDYWLNLIDNDLTKFKHNHEEEDVVLSALARLLKRRIK